MNGPGYRHLTVPCRIGSRRPTADIVREFLSAHPKTTLTATELARAIGRPATEVWAVMVAVRGGR